MGTINIIVGLSGVGKSTVLEEALLLNSKEYEVINFGDRMLEEALERELVDSRDEVKELNSEEQKEIQKIASDSIVEDAKDGNIIVDTHASIKTPQGYLPGLPKWTVKELNPDHIVMIDAKAEEIFERSQEDEGRSREHEEVKGIKQYQEIARSMAASDAVITGSYLKIIENKDGRLKDAAEELASILDN